MEDQHHGFAWQTGKWRVHHRKLRERLAGSTDWFEFEGTSQAWEVMGGAGNIEDNFLNDPGGAYPAIAVRRIDPDTGEWLIWWFDSRFAEPSEPMRGHFADGTGIFVADIVYKEQSVRIRFIWSAVRTATPRWEQALSVDGGQSWETNWIMDWERADG